RYAGSTISDPGRRLRARPGSEREAALDGHADRRRGGDGPRIGERQRLLRQRVERCRPCRAGDSVRSGTRGSTARLSRGPSLAPGARGAERCRAICRTYDRAMGMATNHTDLMMNPHRGMNTASMNDGWLTPILQTMAQEASVSQPPR